DLLIGGPGADTLAGGTGNDSLYGEGGGDTYLYYVGDGMVVIDDGHRLVDGPDQGQPWHIEDDSYWIDDAPNILVLGPGIRPQDLRYTEQDGDLLIEFVNRSGDRILLRGYDPHRATRTRSIDILRFADGSEIVAAAMAPPG